MFNHKVKIYDIATEKSDYLKLTTKQYRLLEYLYNTDNLSKNIEISFAPKEKHYSKIC